MEACGTLSHGRRGDGTCAWIRLLLPCLKLGRGAHWKESKNVTDDKLKERLKNSGEGRPNPGATPANKSPGFKEDER